MFHLDCIFTLHYGVNEVKPFAHSLFNGSPPLSLPILFYSLTCHTLFFTPLFSFSLFYRRSRRQSFDLSIFLPFVSSSVSLPLSPSLSVYQIADVTFSISPLMEAETQSDGKEKQPEMKKDGWKAMEATRKDEKVTVRGGKEIEESGIRRGRK